MTSTGFSIGKCSEDLSRALSCTEDSESFLPVSYSFLSGRQLTSRVRTRISFKPAIYFPLPSGSFLRDSACLLMIPAPPFAKAARFMLELTAPDNAQADDPRVCAVDNFGRDPEAFDVSPATGSTLSNKSKIYRQPRSSVHTYFLVIYLSI